MLDKWHKKEKPVFTGITRGVGGFGFGGGVAAPSSTSASGGTKTTSGEFTIHTFTSNGNFVVSNGGQIELSLIHI